MTFSLLSEARRATTTREGKPETIVIVESDGIIERRADASIHLATALNSALGNELHCTKCKISWYPSQRFCWTDSAELHARHFARCSS